MILWGKRKLIIAFRKNLKLLLIGEPADAKICVDIFVLLRAFGFCRLCSPAKLCCFIGVNIILIIDFIALTASAGF